MSKPELLKKVIEILNHLEVEYMLTGSLVSSLQGEPRATFDMDFLLSLTKEEISSFMKAFNKEHFFIDEREVEEAIEKEDRFVLLEKREGDPIDFWILTRDPFDVSRLSRSYREEFMGLQIPVSSPEDTILSKLRWTSLLGGSEKHFMDALRVYEVQRPTLDTAYLEDWVEKLGLFEEYRNLIKEANIF